ncbi:hypothetical protein BCR43DRAFT_521342 [Syncephalastrum racemosum]|uniref:Uncharacterized protein n=1 Tax=Syncephalastrum racemosum TaxID=13706 RepID=A0A1X2HLN2_SYNRA|nr:hypothetical protein BCR43DRAFT_521342 [Syncephalastrum racemosum]
MNPSDSYEVRTPEQDSPMAGEGGSRIWGIMKGTAKFASREFERFIDTMGFNTVADSSRFTSPSGLRSEIRSNGYDRERCHSIQQATSALQDMMNQAKELDETRHSTSQRPLQRQQQQQPRLLNNDPLDTTYSASGPRTPMQKNPDSDNDDRIKLLERRIEMLQGVVDKLVGPDKVEPIRAPSRSAARLATPSPDLSPRPEEMVSRHTHRSPSPQPLSMAPPVAAPSPTAAPSPVVAASSSPQKISTISYSARETPRTPPPRRALSPLRQRTPLRVTKQARPSQTIKVMPFVEELNRALSKKASPPALTPRPVGAPKLTHIPSQHYDVQQEINEMIPKVQLRRTEMIPGPDGTLQRNKVWTEIYDRKRLYRYKRSHDLTEDSPSEHGSSEPTDKKPRF